MNARSELPSSTRSAEVPTRLLVGGHESRAPPNSLADGCQCVLGVVAIFPSCRLRSRTSDAISALEPWRATLPCPAGVSGRLAPDSRRGAGLGWGGEGGGGRGVGLLGCEPSLLTAVSLSTNRTSFDEPNGDAVRDRLNAAVDNRFRQRRAPHSEA